MKTWLFWLRPFGLSAVVTVLFYTDDVADLPSEIDPTGYVFGKTIGMYLMSGIIPAAWFALSKRQRANPVKSLVLWPVIISALTGIRYQLSKYEQPAAERFHDNSLIAAAGGGDDGLSRGTFAPKASVIQLWR